MAEESRGLVPFPTTCWSEIEAVAADVADGRMDSLNRLLNQYYPALLSHLIYARHLSTHDAEDVLQGFLERHVLSRNLLARADRNRGSKFRTFLMRALDNYLVDVLRHETARKRAPEALMPLDPEHETDAFRSRAFDIAWARSVVSEALCRMETACREDGLTTRWLILERRIVAPTLGETESQRQSYDDLVESLGIPSPQQAYNILVAAKRMYVRALRSVIGEYCSDETQITEELRSLRTILASAARTVVR